MKMQTRLLLAVAACMPAFSGAMAGPTTATINPGTVTRMPPAPIDPQVRRALVPAPATGPCLAELSVDRIEVSRRADRSAYDFTVTVRNSGTEAATGMDGTNGGFLGLKLQLNSHYTPSTQMTYSQQVANIITINPGGSHSYAFSVPARNIPHGTRDIFVRIDRGPDAPRCSYDARRNNDALSVSWDAMRNAFNAGDATFVRVASWAM